MSCCTWNSAGGAVVGQVRHEPTTHPKLWLGGVGYNLIGQTNNCLCKLIYWDFLWYSLRLLEGFLCSWLCPLAKRSPLTPFWFTQKFWHEPLTTCSTETSWSAISLSATFILDQDGGALMVLSVSCFLQLSQSIKVFTQFSRTPPTMPDFILSTKYCAMSLLLRIVPSWRLMDDRMRSVV